MNNVGLMWHGNRETRDTATLENSRFALAAAAFKEVGIEPVAVVYNDDFRDEVRQQLLRLDAVQVWVNPIEGEQDRSRLDALLREVAAAGVLVQTHPDTILKMGTKEVLLDTRAVSWGSEMYLYSSLDQLSRELPEKLQGGKARVLKQYRGQSGGGIWKVSLVDPSVTQIGDSTPMRLRHAQRGCYEETVPFSAVCLRMVPYFAGSGRMIDQPYQERLPEGMIRCYMVVDQVSGFGHQAINALYPPPPGSPPEAAPQPGPRLYYPPETPEFQKIRARMEQEWVVDLRSCLGLRKEDLPLLWDADFLLGPKDEAGVDTYVLCEINVSSVSPYPESANGLLARALLARLQTRR
jgi:hypothetical protein